jgi:glucose/arabinose dehydrogenase
MALVVGMGLSGSAASARGALSLDPLHGTYDQPTYVAQAPGSPQLLFVVEQAGKIAVLRNGQKLNHAFLNINNLVESGGEQGLLSMAFDPNYGSSRRFFVYYTDEDCGGPGGGCNVEVDSFRRSLHSPTRAQVASRRLIIEVNHHQAGNHNGGQLQFGPGGHLYMGIGDGGTQGDPENDAQNRHKLLGKVLRIDPKRRGGYRTPTGNPFVGRPGRNEIFARGLRNPYRFSFDRKTDDLWIGDVGGNQREEIDRAAPARANGANFGWHFFEGRFPCGDCGFGPGTDPPPGYVAPVHDYPHSGGGETGSVIIGGYRVRDPALPSLNGKYVYTDDYAGDLRSYNPQNDSETGLGLSLSAPSSFGEGLDGSIYVTSLGDNKVYELVQGAKAAANGGFSRPEG